MFTKIFELAVAHPALSHYPAFAAETEYQGTRMAGVSTAIAGIVRARVRVAAVSAVAIRFFMLFMLFPPVFRILWCFCKQYNIGMEAKSREEYAI